MKATIRKRTRANGFTVPYVDIVHENERIRKTLPGLKLFTYPRDTHEQQHNKQVNACAERERGVGRFNRILKQEHLTKIEYRGSFALMMETDYWIDKYNERYKGRR